MSDHERVMKVLLFLRELWPDTEYIVIWSESGKPIFLPRPEKAGDGMTITETKGESK
jgi:hypothetical protein